jgi:hypothetical protein
VFVLCKARVDCQKSLDTQLIWLCQQQFTRTLNMRTDDASHKSGCVSHNCHKSIEQASEHTKSLAKSLHPVFPRLFPPSWFLHFSTTRLQGFQDDNSAFYDSAREKKKPSWPVMEPFREIMVTSLFRIEGISTCEKALLPHHETIPWNNNCMTIRFHAEKAPCPVVVNPFCIEIISSWPFHIDRIFSHGKKASYQSRGRLREIIFAWPFHIEGFYMEKVLLIPSWGRSMK